MKMRPFLFLFLLCFSLSAGDCCEEICKWLRKNVDRVAELSRPARNYATFYFAVHISAEYIRSGEYQLAAEWAFKAIKANPSAPQSYSMLGCALYGLGYEEEANIAWHIEHQLE